LLDFIIDKKLAVKLRKSLAWLEQNGTANAAFPKTLPCDGRSITIKL